MPEFVSLFQLFAWLAGAPGVAFWVLLVSKAVTLIEKKAPVELTPLEIKIKVFLASLTSFQKLLVISFLDGLVPLGALLILKVVLPALPAEFLSQADKAIVYANMLFVAILGQQAVFSISRGSAPKLPGQG